MKNRVKLFESNGIQYIKFDCPGCKDTNVIGVKGDSSFEPIWNFNGDTEKPTISPSILARTGHFARHFNKDNETCWCDYNKENEPSSFSCYICHSYVTNGVIEFLGDCTHDLKGQRVELPFVEN